MTFASRNISLCNKDCLCLFICPTGATDTPTGQIDSTRCLDGCRACVDACPSSAIYLVFSDYPEPPAKDKEVAESLMNLCRSKVTTEAAAEQIAGNKENPEGLRLLAVALRRSARILAEDCSREAGYLHPGCEVSKRFLEDLKR